MSILDIGDGLKTRLSTISALKKVYALKELPDSIGVFPAAIILPGETAYVTTLSSNDSDYNFRVIIVVSKQDQPSAITRLLPFMAVSGSSSVVAAIHGDKTLDGKAETCKVSRNTGIGSLAWGGYQYLSTEFAVQVWAE